MPAEVARLPGVHALQLNRTEHGAAKDPTTAIASTVNANQAKGFAWRRGQRVEVESDELFVAVEL
jgi:hypothetical protein